MNARLDRYIPGATAKIHLLVDVIFMALALWLALGGAHAPLRGDLGGLLGGVFLSWFVVTAVLRLYAPLTPRMLYDHIALAVIAVLSATLTVFVLHWVGFYGDVAFQPAVFAVTLFAGVLLNHDVLSHLLPQRMSQPRDAVLIVGTGALGLATYERLRSEGLRNVVAFVSFPGEPDSVPFAGIEVLNDSSLLLNFLKQHIVDEVYLAGRLVYQAGVMQEAVTLCEELGVPFALPLHNLRFERSTLMSASSRRDGYLHYLTQEPKLMQFAVKRLMDIVASGLALALLSPLLILVAVAIRLDSPGPILFRQLRVGMHGTLMNMLKFRSMVIDAEARLNALQGANEQSGPVFKIRKDPRITRVGRILRKYSIDELPQLVNILRGDMTFVGPRPALPSEVAQYKTWQRRRLSVRPGLTCYWQISGRNEISFEEWMQMDLRYVDNWSLRIDVQMILQTVPAAFGGRGAS